MRVALRIVGLACLALASIGLANEIVWPHDLPWAVPTWLDALATVTGLGGFVLTRCLLVVLEARRASLHAHPHG